MSECREELLKQRMKKEGKRMYLLWAYFALIATENARPGMHWKNNVITTGEF